MTKYIMGTTAIALVLAAAPAFAQQRSADAKPSESGLQDIIVTAQKRPEVGQKAPLAVTSINAEALTAAHINGATDLQRVVPNLNAELGAGVGDAGGGNTLFTIRGLGASPTGPQGSPGVASHFDGVYRQDGISNSEFFDLERIEVDPGPQGTLYGRSAAAGAVNILPAKPSNRFEVAGSMSYGNYNAMIAQAMVNIPVSDTLSLRISGQTQNHDGYYSNGYDDQDAKAIRAQLLFKPTPQLSIRLYGSYTGLRGTGAGNIFVGGNPALYNLVPQAGNPDPRKASISNYCFSGSTIVADGANCRQSVHVDKYNAHAEIIYDFGGAVLTLLPAYTASFQNNINANAPLPLSNFNQLPFNNRQYTFEGRLSDNGKSKLKWVVGANYYDNKVTTNVFQSINVLIPLGSPAFPPTAGVPCVVVIAGGGACTGSTVTQPGLGVTSQGAYQLQNSEQKSYAFFGQATYPITDGIRLTVGARYNHDSASDVQVLDSTKNLIYVVNGTGPFASPIASLVPLHPTPPAVGANVSFDAVTYRFAVDADVGPHSIVYASVGSGYKPGGLNDGGPASTSSVSPFAAYAPSVSFGPEKVTHFELGSKNRFMHNTLQINNVIYYDDYGSYQNGQTQVVNPLQNGALGFVVTNAGKARVYGDELSIKWQVSKNDDFDVSVNYLSAKFTNYIAPAFLAAGNQVTPAKSYSGLTLPNAPEWSGNVSYRHTFDLGNSGKLVASAFSHITAGYWLYFAESFGSYQSAHTNTTLDLTWTNASKHLMVSAFVKNLENNNVIAYAGSTNGFTELGYAPPRTYGGSVSFKF